MTNLNVVIDSAASRGAGRSALKLALRPMSGPNATGSSRIRWLLVGPERLTRGLRTKRSASHLSGIVAHRPSDKLERTRQLVASETLG